MVQQVEHINSNIKRKRFSVIIIGYNIEDYIQRAIESVEKQTINDYELIVVNDCSTDKTEEKILEMCNKYGNINYISHKVNKQAGGARNTALDVANGQYIIFLDGDDYLAGNDVLQKLDDVIGNDEPDVIHLGFKIEGDREELVLPTEETCTKTYKAAIDKYPNPWSKCWRKKHLDDNNIRFPENRFYEDVLFVYNGIMKLKTYKIAPFVVHTYISGRKNSMTTTISIKNVDDTVKNLKDLFEMRKIEPTEEIDIIIKKEIKMCKKRLDSVLSSM